MLSLSCRQCFHFYRCYVIMFSLSCSQCRRPCQVGDCVVCFAGIGCGDDPVFVQLLAMFMLPLINFWGGRCMLQGQKFVITLSSPLWCPKDVVREQKYIDFAKNLETWKSVFTTKDTCGRIRGPGGGASAAAATPVPTHSCCKNKSCAIFSAEAQSVLE